MKAKWITDKIEELSSINELKNTEFAADAEKVIRKHFPKSYLVVKTRGPLGGADPIISFALGKDKSAWANGIINNDPLHTVIFLSPFDKDTGELQGDKIKAKMSQGNAYRVNGKPIKKFGWKNGTGKPTVILKKLDKHFKEMADWLKSPEGKEVHGK